MSVPSFGDESAMPQTSQCSLELSGVGMMIVSLSALASS